LVREFIEKVGEHITAIHLKDIVLEPRLTVHLQEVRPGLGAFDIGSCLLSISELMDADVPVLLEHLPTEAEYREAHAHVLEVAARVGVAL